MATTLLGKPLARGTLTDTSQHSVYTVTTGATGYIKTLLLVNTTGATLTVTAWVVPSGGTVGSNGVPIAYNAQVIPGDPSLINYGALPLSSGDFIVLQASAAGIAYYLGGAE